MMSLIAQVSGGGLGPATLWPGTLTAAIYGAIGIALLLLGYWLFDRITPRIDVQKELTDKNVAVAIVAGAPRLRVAAGPGQGPGPESVRRHGLIDLSRRPLRRRALRRRFPSWDEFWVVAPLGQPPGHELFLPFRRFVARRIRQLRPRRRLLMLRHRCEPRPDWQKTVESQGMHYHTLDDVSLGRHTVLWQSRHGVPDLRDLVGLAAMPTMLRMVPDSALGPPYSLTRSQAAV